MLAILRSAVLAILALAIALPASAQRPQRDWVLLGQQEVGFMVDRDVINVDREGVRFSQLRIEAERNDVYMISLRLVYQNGYAEDFRVDRELKAGLEALPIDLRGERSYLSKIELVYRARPDFRGRSIVRVYGELHQGRRPEFSDGPRFEVIASLTVSRMDRGPVVFNFDRGEGRYARLRFQARDGGVRIRDVRITLRNGDTQVVTVEDRLNDNEMSRTIDLEGDRRSIRSVQVEARPTRGERDATLVLLGEKDMTPPRRRPDLGNFAPIDKQRISRRNDDGIVEFDVGRDEGRFGELRFLAADGDIFIREALIVFGNGETQRARIRDRLNEDDLSETIDLAGESRAIRKVQVRARLARGERDATLILLGREDDRRRHRMGDRGGPREEWVTLGRQRAAILKADTDVFKVGRDMGTFRAIRVVVHGGEVRFYSMTIRYGNGSTEDVPLTGVIRSGEVSKPFDLSGRDRFIESITFKYRSKLSLAGTGSIEIQGLKQGPYRGR